MLREVGALSGPLFVFLVVGCVLPCCRSDLLTSRPGNFFWVGVQGLCRAVVLPVGCVECDCMQAEARMRAAGLEPLPQLPSAGKWAWVGEGGGWGASGMDECAAACWMRRVWSVPWQQHCVLEACRQQSLLV